MYSYYELILVQPNCSKFNKKKLIAPAKGNLIQLNIYFTVYNTRFFNNK